MTTPPLLSHQRRTMPQPCSEPSQVMTAMWAEPVSPAGKAAWSEMGTNGHRGRPISANSSRTSLMKTAASEMAGGRVVRLS